MNSTATQTAPAPPSLIAALLAGFDAVTNHIGIILFPVLLDLLLWLGPHLRIGSIVQGILGELDGLPLGNTPDSAQALAFTREVWQVIGERLNLFTLLRSYPVGIPSLMASRLPVETPLAFPQMIDIPSPVAVLGLWLALTLSGLVVGSLYYLLVAQASLNGRVDVRSALVQWGEAARQVVLLALTLGGIFLLVSIPGSCFLSLITISASSFSSLGLMLYVALLLWILFPLLLSAHGIFTFQQKVLPAMRHSAALTRMTLVRTSLLFLAILLISEGLDTLWRVPAENSWLVLVGVAGHAFVSTSLLAASFIYYRDATRWMQRLVQQSLMNAPDRA